MWWHSLLLKVVASKVGERMFKTNNELKTQSKNNNA
jgi:hypothetical protein